MTDLMTAPGALEGHRRELGAHCRRMLGSASEADDAVQETFVRAWRSFQHFEGRSSLRTWLYRIATNVCTDMRGASQRRALPTDPASWTTVAGDDPAEQAVARDTVRLALGAALLHLPPRQRSVLILRDVLRWRASEVAELLGTTVASVNSALQRARSGLAAAPRSVDRARPAGPAELPLLQRYVDAFERHDVDALVALLRDR